MATASDLERWVIEALTGRGGEARVPRMAQHICEHHEAELRASGDLFYTWQYAMRRAGQRQQKAGRLIKKTRKWAPT